MLYYMYLEKTLYLYAKVVILLMVFNVALSFVDSQYNVLLWIVRTPQNLRYLYFFIALVALWVASKRETYLPFLGECVLPSSLLKEGSNVKGDKLVEIDIEVPSSSQIVWWASNPSEEKSPNPDVWKAYDDYMNSGVVNVKNGVAKITFLCPQEYTVKKTLMTKHLKKHIHYREVNNKGMLGAIKTVYVNC